MYILNRLLSLNIKSHHLIARCRQTTRNSSFYAIKLENKQLIRLSGSDSVLYLQSLLTNDVRHLLPNQTDVPHRSCLYAYMLNAAGRVLCDLMVYRGKVITDGEFLLEVDSSLANALRRVLWGYNLWPDIKVEAVKDVHLWALIPKVFGHDINFMHEIISDDLQIVSDPRTPLMGYRLLSRIGGLTFADMRRFVDADIEEKKLSDYRSYRFKLGITEGLNDLMSAKYYPFECNADYLNAVSVLKGLYLSEAKAFKIYTGQPIIKRMMPIKFECEPKQLIENKVIPHTLICSRKYGQLGNIINMSGRYGIASLKCIETFKATDVLYHDASNIRIKVWKPEWWPLNPREIHMPQVDYVESLLKVVLLADEKPKVRLEDVNTVNTASEEWNSDITQL